MASTTTAQSQPQTSTSVRPPSPSLFPSPPFQPPSKNPRLANHNAQPVDLASLPTSQLTTVKSQLGQELQHLTASFGQLKAAQGKFRDCGVSVRDGVEGRKEGTLFSHLVLFARFLGGGGVEGG